MDFLGLRNLAILDRAVKIAKEVHQVEIDLLNIDYEDPKVLALFGEGDMTGVFQFESSGMRRYLKELKPSSFEDLIAMVSLYRPGPLQYIPEFIDRKHGRKVVEYPHPSLENILQPTYGIAVYQEQIMQLVQAFAGFSLGEADILRRAIGKKKYDLLMEQREKFILAAQTQGHPEELATYIFDEIIEPFAGYGFNKSHAACYSMIAYQTAYMKTYYPTESAVALMVSDEEDIDRIRMEITEVRAKGVNVLPPDVNESRKHFTFIDQKNIRFGLKAIKGLGDGPINIIRAAVKEKKFTSIQDFIERTGGAVINKKSLESLIYSGALDAFGERNSLLKSIPKMTEYLKEIDKKNQTSQIGLFDLDNTTTLSFELEKVEPLTFEEKMKGEKGMIGYPVSGHPLEGLEDFILERSKNVALVTQWLEKLQNPDENNTENTDENPKIGEESIPENLEKSKKTPEKSKKKAKKEENATLIGLVTETRHIPTKTGGNMIIAKVESAGFDFIVAVFPRDYALYKEKIIEDTIIIVEGKLRFDEERGEVSISPATPFYKSGEKNITSNSIRPFSITQFHQFAFGAGAKKDNSQPKNSCEITIPPFWSRDDLLLLKDFLLSLPKGEIEVFLSIK